MALPPQFLDEIKARIELSELIGRRVKLIRRGREHSGLCPFHNEKTPSFTVSDDKGFYHCFGCGAHGGAFDFVMATEGASFPEAVERLAAQAGMEVPRASPEDQARSQRRKSLYEVMELVAGWYESQLAASGGAAARDYLAGRGVDAPTVARFRLGHAPNRRDGLKSAMLARHVGEDDLVETGMLIRPDDGGESYDRFRGRLMFPITDRGGRTIAFGGRALGEARAKYLNSPETPLFHKGATLYNLAGARKAAHEAGELVVCEGYMDVIALVQAGIEAAVAPLGTALTEDQLRALWRVTPVPALCFDGDEAGKRAAARAAERALALLRPGHSLGFVELPRGEDPDSLIRARGAAEFHRLLANAVPLADLLWRGLTQGGRFDTPESQAGLRQDCGRIAKQITDDTVREYYRRFFKGRLTESFPEPGPRGGRWSGRHADGPGRRPFRDRYRRIPASAALGSGEGGDPAAREQNLMAALAHHPKAIERVLDELMELTLSSPELDRLRREIIHIGARGEPLDEGSLRHDLVDSASLQTIEDLTTRRIKSLELFARPEASLEDVVKGWMHTFKLHRRTELRHELEAARQKIDVTTEEGFARFTALKKALDEAEAEAVGIGE